MISLFMLIGISLQYIRDIMVDIKDVYQIINGREEVWDGYAKETSCDQQNEQLAGEHLVLWFWVANFK